MFKNIEFIHVLEYSASNYILSGYFGLQLPKKNKINIFDNFKKSNAISSTKMNIHKKKSMLYLVKIKTELIMICVGI